MKPVKIDFVPDQRWRVVWAVALLVGLCLTGAATWRVWHTWQSTQALQSQVAEVQNHASDEGLKLSAKLFQVSDLNKLPEGAKQIRILVEIVHPFFS